MLFTVTVKSCGWQSCWRRMQSRVMLKQQLPVSIHEESREDQWPQLRQKNLTVVGLPLPNGFFNVLNVPNLYFCLLIILFCLITLINIGYFQKSPFPLSLFLSASDWLIASMPIFNEINIAICPWGTKCDYLEILYFCFYISVLIIKGSTARVFGVTLMLFSILSSVHRKEKKETAQNCFWFHRSYC